jgi:hypothetical protein
MYLPNISYFFKIVNWKSYFLNLKFSNFWFFTLWIISHQFTCMELLLVLFKSKFKEELLALILIYLKIWYNLQLGYELWA